MPVTSVSLGHGPHLLPPAATVAPPSDFAAALTAAVEGRAAAAAPSSAGEEAAEDDTALRDAFRQFVGETLFGEMLKAMRATVPKGAYFHGGTAEEIFRGQLDQVLAERLARTSGEALSAAMYERFALR